MEIEKVDGHYVVVYYILWGPLSLAQERKRIFNDLPDLLEFIKIYYGE